MSPAEAARVTAALSHIGGILDALPLTDYLEQLRQERDALPHTWDREALTAYQAATRRRLQALIAAGTKALEIVDEVHTASAFWSQARAIEREDPGTPTSEAGAAILVFPPGARRPPPDSCKCPMGECEHKVGFDGLA